MRSPSVTRRQYLAGAATASAGCLGGGDNGASDDREVRPPTQEKSGRDVTATPDVSSEEYLTGDGETDDADAFAEMIEAVADDGGGTILLEEPAENYRFENTAKPQTGGESVTVVTAGPVTIDGTGSGDILNFGGSGNVSLLGPLTVEGDPGSGFAYSVITGENFYFENLTLDGGQGGLNCDFANVEGYNLTVRNHHDVDSGWVGCINGGPNTDDVHIEGIHGENCDRGIEFENGSTNVYVSDGVLVDIDNAQADDPGTVFVLDVHSHAEKPLTENITYERFEIRDCGKAISFQGRQDGGPARNLTARDVTIIDSGGSGQGPPEPILVRDAEDVLIENVVVDTANEDGRYPGSPNLFHAGTRFSDMAVETEVTVRNVEFRAAARGDPIRTSHAVVELDGVDVYNPGGHNDRALSVESEVEYLRAEGLELHDEGFDAAVEVADGGLVGGPDHEWGGVLSNCDLEAGLVVRGANAPILVEGRTAGEHDVSPDTRVEFRE